MTSLDSRPDRTDLIPSPLSGAPDMLPGEAIIYRFVKSRLNRNLNAIVVTVGASGTGKSWLNLRIAQLIDPTFNESRIVFSMEDYLHLLNRPGALPRGSVVIWDESGIGAAARDFASRSGKILSMVLESVRYRGHALFLNLPNFFMLDVSGRRMAHLVIETEYVTADHLVRAKPFVILHRPRFQEPYMAYPQEHLSNQPTTHIIQISVGPPTPEIADAYEKKRDRFIIERYAGYETELRDARAPKKAGRASMSGFDREARDNEIMSLHREGKTAAQVAARAGISSRQVERIIRKERAGE